jgi:hypothetical protein
MSDKPERSAALDFAARIKSAVHRKRDAEKSARQLERERRQRIDLALVRLFDDLEAMGKAAEVLLVDRRKLRIRIRLDQREIVIQSRPTDEQPDRLEIHATGVEEALTGYLGAEIDRWALKIDRPEKDGRPAHTQVYALLGKGMAWLVEHGLALSLDAPEADDAQPPFDRDL